MDTGCGVLILCALVVVGVVVAMMIHEDNERLRAMDRKRRENWKW